MLPQLTFWQRMVQASVVGLLLALVAAVAPSPARANVAPPETAAGAAPAPQGATQVRMTEERITLTLNDAGTEAEVTGTYILFNPGTEAETLMVRFPLSYLTDEGMAPQPCPEIANLQVRVNGESISWQRTEGPPTSYCHEQAAPWAAFSVTFPATQEVTIQVSYTQTAWGATPYRVLTYIVETGAGWADTIGRGEIIVRLPYAASEANVLVRDAVGFGHTTPGVTLQGNEVRWAFQQLEPGPGDNFQLVYMEPAAWQRIEAARQRTRDHAQDPQAWLELSRALRAALLVGPGLMMRSGPGAEALWQEAVEGLNYAAQLAPQNADVHFALGEWLIAWATQAEHEGTPEAHAAMRRGVEALAQALTLNPQHRDTRAFLENYGQMPFFQGWLVVENGTYRFVGLTATPPAPPTATPGPVQQPGASPTAQPSGGLGGGLGGTPTAGLAPSAGAQPRPTDHAPAPAPTDARGPMLRLALLAMAALLVLMALAAVAGLALWRRRGG